MKKQLALPFRILKWIVVTILILIAVAFLFLGFLTLIEYRPDDVETVAPEASVSGEKKTLSVGDDVGIVTWNIGYCGLSETADFFMDGGKAVQSQDKESVLNNLSSMEDVLESINPDVMYIQEIDVDSTRTYGIDETKDFKERFAEYSTAFAKNFDVFFIPYPIPPMGRMEAGIQTLSKYDISSAERIALPSPFSWPSRVGNLKRCLLVSRVPVEGTDKEFVFVNLHLEAYDDGAGKAAQTALLANFIQEEYEKGNYVVAGGDFNQTFSNVDTSVYPVLGEDYWQAGLINTEDFAEGWQFEMDTTHPTCRSLDKPYAGHTGNFQFYMLDGFIVSKNLKVDRIETIDQEFKNTDHNPVYLKVIIEE